MSNNANTTDPPDVANSPQSTPSDLSLLKLLSPNDVTPVFPVEICMNAVNPKHPQFLYQFGDDPSKCYKFRTNSATRTKNGNFPIYCCGCSIVNYKMGQLGGPYKNQRVERRGSDGYKMLADPHFNHVVGCVPMDYEDVILNTPLVREEVKEKIIKGEDISMHLIHPESPFSIAPVRLYPITMGREQRSGSRPMFIHQLRDDPTKCHRFFCRRLSINGDFLVICKCCYAAYSLRNRRGENVPYPMSRRISGYNMLSDPELGHSSYCIPALYEKLVTKPPALANDTDRQSESPADNLSLDGDISVCAELLSNIEEPNKKRMKLVPMACANETVQYEQDGVSLLSLSNTPLEAGAVPGSSISCNESDEESKIAAGKELLIDIDDAMLNEDVAKDEVNGALDGHL